MSLIDVVVLVLVISWLGGFTLHIGGGLIHLLLVVAVIIFLLRLLGINL